MKLASLLAGVAVVALSATAASAQEIQTFSRGQFTTPTTGSINLNPIIPGAGSVSYSIPNNTHTNVPSSSIPLVALGQIVANEIRANNADSTSAAWHANGVAIGNVGGDGDESDQATFTLSGNVSEDCAFYTGSSNSLSFDFGQIGIYTSDNTGAAAAFTMVAPAVMNFDTNLAGCNTASTVTLTKLGASPELGLVNSSAGSYDDDVFQANLPYNITARYTATTGAGAESGTLQTLTVGNGQASNFAAHGAWKSNMDITVAIPQADQALVAGDYSGSFRVVVAAAM